MSMFSYVLYLFKTSSSSLFIVTIRILIFFFQFQVRSVSYVMLTALAALNRDSSVRMLTIPRGFELDFYLSYFDALGRAFHGVRNQLNFRPSRFDLMRIDYDSGNSSLTVYADKVGQTLLHISDDFNPGLNEYIRFDVADVIQPSQVNNLQT